MREFPRVLFFTSEIPQSVNAGSMQLYRVLQGYSGEKLMVMGWPPEKDAKLLPCRYETVKLLTYRMACTRFRHWMSGLNALNTLWEPQLGRSEKIAREFRPEVVVTVMDKLSYYKHAWALARRLKVPLMTITMDDPEIFESAHPLLSWAQKRLLKKIYSYASLSLGVSREMGEYLEREFQKKTEVFYFGPPEGIRPRPTEESVQLKNPDRLTLGYAGSLGLGYEQGIRALLPVLEKTGTLLNLYTRDQHCVPKHSQVRNRGFHPVEELWPLVQKECDVLLLPYAPEGRMTRLYRTHFPTKLSEYCWAGMPILVTGPQDATGLLWAGRHPEACVAAELGGGGDLRDVLLSLKTSGEKRKSMAGASPTIARKQFDPLKIRSRLNEILSQL